jgi:hypothetical protein
MLCLHQIRRQKRSHFEVKNKGLAETNKGRMPYLKNFLIFEYLPESYDLDILSEGRSVWFVLKMQK